MAAHTIHITLLSVLFVLYLPCPLFATEHEQRIVDAVKNNYHTCYEKCVLREHRFPCEDDSTECGDCLFPITTQGASCKVLPDNANHQRLLDMISKRDEGAGAGDVPPLDVAEPPADQDPNPLDPDTGEQGQGAQDTAPEEGQTDPSLMAALEEVEAQESDGGVILLEEWQFILIVVGCVLVAIIGVAIAFVCWYKIQNTSKAQNDVDYPSYGVTGPGTQVTAPMINGDRKLAQSAQMYHYQHQKQQMIAMEKREKGEVQRDASDYDSEEENEDGDLTVYECPGLAPTGEMQVKNPLFAEDGYSKPAGEEEGEGEAPKE